jgi:DHA2 family multidrug resistance protein
MYLRGVAMGMLFSPLSALAMTEISRHEMAQASGLTNVIRQVGGSFGVAILQTILTQRILFHTAISGAGLDSASPVFMHSRQLLQMHAIHDAGSTVANAAAQSTALLLSHFSQQMFVYAINDDFFIACMCTLACAIPILILKRNKNRKMI